jgi:hypothetical protein
MIAPTTILTDLEFVAARVGKLVTDTEGPENTHWQNCADKLAVALDEAKAAIHAMPKFALRNLAVLNYAMGFTGWLYRAGSAPLSHVLTQGFFDDAQHMFGVGDTITITATEGTMIVGVRSTAPAVTVAEMARTKP